MRVRPISPSLVVTELSERIAASGRDSWLRVAIDGAPPAAPSDLADALVSPLRALGRDVVRVSADDFLRPASLRYEFGRDDPDLYYDEWLDVNGLVREVLAPLEPSGTGKVLPSLWDADLDRATRARYVSLQPGGVCVLDGSLLLGRGLPFELTVHLTLSRGALARRMPDDRSWTLPAYARYEREADPLRTADVVLKMDDPGHPALITDA
ncbi:uridine kinase [Actinomadura bangladeshensis]|uniref:Uridine kinase n=1 Tax=Actinomadura bangladeshensis TaxID=453573 RepID=A0A6L9QCS9_9ACTN|nr:uridine kinase [Actinomadura bangladeshensis]NEA22816.1 uridine kinase [Actinomadura bangladeshensis]